MFQILVPGSNHNQSVCPYGDPTYINPPVAMLPLAWCRSLPTRARYLWVSGICSHAFTCQEPREFDQTWPVVTKVGTLGLTGS